MPPHRWNLPASLRAQTFMADLLLKWPLRCREIEQTPLPFTTSLLVGIHKHWKRVTRPYNLNSLSATWRETQITRPKNTLKHVVWPSSEEVWCRHICVKHCCVDACSPDCHRRLKMLWRLHNCIFFDMLILLIILNVWIIPTWWQILLQQVCCSLNTSQLHYWFQVFIEYHPGLRSDWKESSNVLLSLGSGHISICFPKSDTGLILYNGTPVWTFISEITWLACTFFFSWSSTLLSYSHKFAVIPCTSTWNSEFISEGTISI